MSTSSPLSLSIVVILAGCAMAPIADAETHVVRPDGSGDFLTIDAAIQASEDGDVIELTDGTFTGDGNRDLGFSGKAITVRSQSGNSELCIIDAQGSVGDPHRAFDISGGEGPASILEGVTLTGGLIESPRVGGGLVVRNGSNPSVRSCRFVDNEGASAGGVWVQSSTPSFFNCVFLENRATTSDGGGVFLTNASATFVDCQFLNNTAGGAGGAMSCNFAAAPTFTGCTFSGNEAAAGGAVWATDDAAPSFTNCTFSGNSAPSDRGVIGGRLNAVYTLTACLIVNSPQGSAVRCDSPAEAIATCCNVFGNAGGDWVGCLDGLLGTGNNLSDDPQFCSSSPDADRYWWVQSDSPCAQGNQPDCGTIGAWEVGCDITPTKAATWGAIKAGAGD